MDYMNDIKRICIFCASSNIIDPEYFKDAEILASLFAEKKFELVFGGGKKGLMGRIAEIFKKKGCRIIGVIPKKLNKPGITFRDADEIIETETMQERKSIMTESANAFVALAGGFGTLEEILEVISMKQLGFHKKPFAILNTNNLYDFLFKQFNVLSEEKFIDKKNMNTFFSSTSADEVFNYVMNKLAE
jgi:cytokinin riboside 5'-monophosphate phosphoribohydrolase